MGILQARILEWIAIPFSRGISQPGLELWSPASQADSSSFLSSSNGKSHLYPHYPELTT